MVAYISPTSIVFRIRGASRSFEDYANIVLKVFDMINVYAPKREGLEIKEPPLGKNQMVVWNGGAGGYRFAFLPDGQKLLFGSVKPSPAALIRAALK